MGELWDSERSRRLDKRAELSKRESPTISFHGKGHIDEHLQFPFWVLAGYQLHAKDIVIATSSMTLTSIPYLVAIEKKFFEKEGLAAQYVVMRSDLAVKGLITGDVDYNQSVSSVLRAALPARL